MVIRCFLRYDETNVSLALKERKMTDPTLVTHWFTYPQFDPIAFQLGPFAIRWYALSYIVGLLGGWQILRQLAKTTRNPISQIALDQLLNWVLFGVILGGRLGYVLFYKPETYLTDPLATLRIWEGGMAFHGGFLGVVIAVILFARRHKIPLWALGDRIALVAPLGLFFGRLANFINGELYGRITTHPAGMVFPSGGPEPRHPSQLYEAGLEGLLLGLILIMAWRWRLSDKAPGMMVGLFVLGYGMARFIVEFAREPDPHIGLYELSFVSLSHGQLLSVPMIAVGLALIYWRKTKARVS